MPADPRGESDGYFTCEAIRDDGLQVYNAVSEERVSSCSRNFLRWKDSILSHLKKSELQAKFALDLDGEITKNEEAAICARSSVRSLDETQHPGTLTGVVNVFQAMKR